MKSRRSRKTSSESSSRSGPAARFIFGLFLLALIAACCDLAQKPSKEPKGAAPPVSPAPEVREPSLPEELAPTVTDESCLKGCPENLDPKKRNTILRREGFVLSNNPETKFADWAAYRITSATIAKSKKRFWIPDPDLPESETLEPEDFKGAHAALDVDRGHQVPLASFSGTKAWQALNYLSNLTPQRSFLNQRLWNHLEQAERELALSPGVASVYVFTGPLFEREMKGLPGADESHRVPSGYFKIVALFSGNEITLAAFLVDQDTPSRDSYCDHQVTVREVEKRARLDFLRGVPDAQERVLEESRGTLGPRLGCP